MIPPIIDGFAQSTNSYLEPPRGLPVAALGLFYFTGILAFVLVAGRGAFARVCARRVLFTILYTGFATSCFYVVVMARVIGAWCPLCVAAHVVNFATLILVHRIASIPAVSSSTSSVVPRLLAGAIATSILACTSEWTLYRWLLASESMSRLSNDVSQYVNDTDRQFFDFTRSPKQAIPIDGDSLVVHKGENPTVDVVVFSDPECDHCARLHRLLDSTLVPELGDVMRICWKYFPVDKRCNKGVPHRHNRACLRSWQLEGVRRSRGLASFLELKKYFFSHIGQVSLRQSLSISGLGELEFARLDSVEGVADHVRSDIETGHSLGIKAVPAVFINGRHLNILAATNVRAWRMIIAHEVNR